MAKRSNFLATDTQIRDVNYVDDVVDALIICAQSKKTDGEVYNLGGSRYSNISVLEAISATEKILNKKQNYI